MGSTSLEQRTDLGLHDWNRGQAWGYTTGTEGRHWAMRLEQRTDMGLCDWNRGQTWGLQDRNRGLTSGFTTRAKEIAEPKSNSHQQRCTKSFVSHSPSPLNDYNVATRAGLLHRTDIWATQQNWNRGPAPYDYVSRHA